jgi:hypothetical protein
MMLGTCFKGVKDISMVEIGMSEYAIETPSYRLKVLGGSLRHTNTT